MADLPVVRIDVERGIVQSPRGERVLMVSAEEIDSIARELAPAALLALGRAIGRSAGEAVAAQLGGTQGVAASSLEAVTHHLALELGLRGLGMLAVERWGRALVLALEDPALGYDDLNALVLQGALSIATDRVVTCLSLGREGNHLRVLVASARTVARARGMLAAGLAWGDVLVRLHAGGDA